MKKKNHNPLFINTAFFILVFCLVTSGVFSNTDQDKKEPEKKLEAAIDFGLDVSQGNTTAFGINAGMNISFEFEQKTEIIFSSSINYLETDGSKNADKMNCQILFDHRLVNRITFFLLANPSKNGAQKIDFRLETGGGFKYDIIDNYLTKKEILNTDLSISGALIYELTNRIDLEKKKIGRLSIRPKLKQQLSENLELEIILFYQPKINEFNDYRVQLESGIRFKISKSIFYLFKFMGEYNNVVPEDVQKKDYRFFNQLSVSL